MRGVALPISALVFRELATLDGPRVIAGALLIVLGAVVVATSQELETALGRLNAGRLL